jgi:beta-galactosidase
VTAPVVPRVSGLLYGGDYNPEQWPEEMWLEDVRLMQEAGVNIVTVGVFSWALLEPEPGIFDFEWLDRIVDLLWEHGVAVDLATPTAAPPAWLVRAHPEVLPETKDGVRLEFGSRRHYCPSAPRYREASIRIAEELARRYGSHPALAMWHVDNEYGCHVAECYCAISAEHFRRWLTHRYGSIEGLNRAWGTAFWGQRYGDFAQVEPPRRTPASVNPTQALDWRRFTSDALLECYELQRTVLAALTPKIPITTNFMLGFEPCDYWRWSSREDVVTLDSYPDPADAEAHVLAALDYDLTRSEARGRPWLLLEHAAGAVNWREVNVPKRPGLRRLWALQAVARGSDGAMFFQWRQAEAGAEKFHSSLLPHLGTASRGWQETLRLGRELQALAEVTGTTSRAEVAFLFDWESWWAFDGPDHPSRTLDLRELVLDWYRPFFAAKVAVDFAHPLDDLGRYRLVVAPNLYLASNAVVESLTRYVHAGGVLAVGLFSLVVDENEHARCGAALEPVRRLLGVRVDEAWPLRHDAEETVHFDEGEGSRVRDWTEWLALEGAAAIAHYASGVLEGLPAVVRNVLGDGVVYYCSARLDPDGFARLARRLTREASVAPLLDASAGVEVTRRSADDRSYLFLLNHTDAERVVDLGGIQGFELLGCSEVSDRITLDPLGVAVLRERSAGR